MAVGKPFEKGNPGKPKGAVSKISKAVKDVIADVFTEIQSDPKANMVAWAKQNPTEFYKIAAKLIPVQLTGENGKGLTFTINYNNQPGNEPLNDN